MFEMMNAELAKSEMKNSWVDSDLEQPNRKTVQIKPSMVDRALGRLGQVLITTGLKLKYRQYARISSEEAHSPNFMIML